jgi:Domain of unknown function (DUF1844).
MNEPKIPHEPTRDEMMTALFAHLVMQQSNMAMMLMGKAPHPETGKPVRDLESAKLFIDLLEMLETKTRGNLTKEEQNLLKQTLMAVRMGFVEAVESSPAQPEAKPAPQSTEATKSPDAEKAPSPETPPPAQEESHKKFTKKY